MVTIVPSRFAGLRIEDDDEDFEKPKQRQKTASNSKRAQSQSNQSGSVGGGQKNQAGNNQGQNQQQKKQKPKKSKGSANPQAQQEQWSKWQEKDTEIIDNHYEKDLQQALMLSKLDFEANKTKYVQAEKEAKLAAKPKKSRPLSLQQFQTKVEKDTVEKETQRNRKEQEAEYNRKYTIFEQVELETKQIIHKEQVKQMIADRGYALDSDSSHKDAESEEPPAEMTELDLLKAENISLKNELETLRTKHRKICAFLKTGEMKDKTELLIEIEKLKRTQQEMMTEMTTLYAELEQEKSKLERGGKDRTTGGGGAGGRKSVRFDASTEVQNGKAE